ncbi:MAG: PD-(D/E)XK motif protein [Clostridia bacterium]|nr:PD-(D/E)XK motif protein [Clostridia bacterium]
MKKNIFRDCYNYMKNGQTIMQIENTNNLYAVKEDGYFGVAVDIPMDAFDYEENFENILCVTRYKNFNDSNHKLFQIITDRLDHLDFFFDICENFVSFCTKQENISILVLKAYWIDELKAFVGNRLVEESSYSFLAELKVLEYLLTIGKNAILTKDGTYDIECDKEYFEVKSTISRYNSNIHVNSQYQLVSNSDESLKIVFVRLEELENGISIIETIEKLRILNYNVETILQRAKRIDSDALNKKYCIHEARIYNVDDNFPKITPEMFPNETFPKGIIKVEYTIDLDSLTYEKIDLK